jgi:hypothetical protein
MIMCNEREDRPMPNPVPARYTVQLGPTVTPEVAGELAAWAEVQQRSTSEITRECIDYGLENLRKQWVRVYGALGGTLLAFHVDKARERGEKQVARRRGYDERTRSAEPVQAPRKPVAKRAAKRQAA